MVFWDTVGMSVVLIEAPHAIHFIVDAAGDVLNVLHMGPERNTDTHLLETSTRETFTLKITASLEANHGPIRNLQKYSFMGLKE